MFENVGEKIKAIAVALFWVVAIASVIGAIVLTVKTDTAVYLLIALVGIFSAYVSALLVYGYGEMVENSSSTAISCAKAARNTNTIITQLNDPIEKKD
jgi:hypothetical protein